MFICQEKHELMQTNICVGTGARTLVEVLFICSQCVLLSLCQIHHLRPKAKRAQSSYVSSFSWFSFLDFCWLFYFYCVHVVALSCHHGHMGLNYLWYGTTRNLHLFEFQDFSIKEISSHTFCNLINVKCSCCWCFCYCYYYYYYSTILLLLLLLLLLLPLLLLVLLLLLLLFLLLYCISKLMYGGFEISHFPKTSVSGIFCCVPWCYLVWKTKNQAGK